MRLLIFNSATKENVIQDEISIKFTCIDKERGYYKPETPFVLAMFNEVLALDLKDVVKKNHFVLCDSNDENEQSVGSYKFSVEQPSKEENNG